MTVGREHGPRVLVAEDEPGVREFVARALGHAGLSVTAVTDGQHALEALLAEPFDLLVTDIVMPVLDGIELALIAAKYRPGMPILLITGYPAERSRGLNLDALIHGVLAKPFSLSELVGQAKAALALS